MEKRKYWTNEDENFLKENYASSGAKFCAEKLDRTEQSVFNKANKLKLKSPRTKQMSHEDYENMLFDREIAYWPIEDYQGSKVAILHECVSGHQWSVIPNSILNGSGCPYCSGKAKKTTEEYSALINYKVLEEYINKDTHILHRCPYGHEWKAAPGKILQGRGCPTCAQKSFDRSKPAILYYIKLIKEPNLIYYKIGITNKTVTERFKAEKHIKIKILLEKHFEIGYDAEKEEQNLLRHHKVNRVVDKEMLLYGGHTELFDKDILELDND